MGHSYTSASDNNTLERQQMEIIKVPENFYRIWGWYNLKQQQV